MSSSQRKMDQIRALLSKSRAGSEPPFSGNLGDLASIFDGGGWDEFEDDFDPRKVTEWIRGLEEVEEHFPRIEAVGRPNRIEIDRIYECGEIQGRFIHGDTTFRVYASISMEPAPAGCSCPDSEGYEPCGHGLAFVRGVRKKLQSNQKLIHRIKRGSFESGTPSREWFEPDKSTVAISALQELVASSSQVGSADAADDDLLPELAPVVSKRILWDLYFSGDSLKLQPFIQQRKKRGDGFTKGKKISLERLRSHHGAAETDADRRVINCIQRSQYYYYRSNEYEVDITDALPLLVGQENVAFNGQPIAFESRPLFLAIGNSENGSRICITDEGAANLYGQLFVAGNLFMRHDQANERLLISELDQDQATLVTSLMNLPPVAPEHRPKLVDQFAQLQSHLSVFLPEDVGGPVVSEAGQLAMLLRSQPDGKLDYGIRIRDTSGVLRRPLDGPRVTATERGGEKVQVLRSPELESQRIEELLSRWKLKIDRSNWFGTIDDFESGLRLIENLQSPESDVEVLWDRRCEKPVTVLGSLSSSNVKVDITNKRNWFGITGECNFGDQSMPLGELMAGLTTDGEEGIGDYIKLGDGQWARISEGLRKRLQRLRDATHLDRKTLKLDATAAPAIRELVDSDVAVKATRAWEKCIRRLASAEKLVPVLPENLDATLRDYQIDGYKWLRRLAEWGVGGILADDMGLGKTLQTLAVLVDRAADGPALVIAPTSVGFNWVREAERFAPDLDVHLYRETERGDFLPTVGPNALVVCSYGLALRDAEALGKVEWSTMVLDEAQAIKNSRSKTSKAIASIEADWTVALTGTPVENHLGELWSLFHVVSPGVFGGWEHFRKRFAGPIEKEGSEKARAALADRLKPFVLRRTKSEVLTELPPRTEMNLYVDLSPAERAEYEKIRLAAIGEIDSIESLPHIQDQRFKILALMTRLRQISCHAGLVNKQWTESSAKLDQLCETLDSLREEGHRALIFSQFTEHLALIRKALDERGFTYEYLDGSTPAKARQTAVDRFQTGSADAFLISLKAGGTGLNLTAADYVIHMDPWWNPAVEDQATDRAHRMGQDKPVMVYRIVARGTIEEEILALHESKRDLVAGVMQGTEAAAKLTNDDLIRMLRG